MGAQEEKVVRLPIPLSARDVGFFILSCFCFLFPSLVQNGFV